MGDDVAEWAGLIDECFVEQVRRRPHATALVYRDQWLSYQDLLARAEAVAEELRRAGAGRETVVALAFPRGADAVIAMLGIVLAGGAYLPINPSHPRARVERILAASGAPLLIGPDGVVRLSEASKDNGVQHNSPLAYVMYTSGSTGNPKGVMVEHAGILRLVTNTDYLDFSPEQRVLAAAALEFDASTLEIWGALLNGATLYVIDTETALVPARYAAALREYGITFAWLTAPLFHQLVDEDPTIFAPLRTLVTGGDVVSPAHVNTALAANPELRIYNGYGPTENTTFTTVYEVDGQRDGPLPIGRPIPGTTVRVCDETGREVPAGVVGELYTAGYGLARGYLNDPGLTASRFVDLDGVRHYRIGDRVHADADGLLHFHGRVDDQVKIRGNLVVLGEVTAALLAVPGVRDACTRALGGPADRRLVAYLVAPGVDVATVRGHCAATLPGYLCPEQLVLLDRLPLNDNGKVDWRALAPPPDAGETAPRTAHHTPVQARLAELWAGVLAVPGAAIDPADSFFDLGGNSLKLGVLLGRIAGAFGVQLGFAETSAAPTLAAMADAVASADAAPVSAIPALPPGAAGDLHPAQRALFAIWQAYPESVAYNIPVRLDLFGPVRPQRLRAALTDLVRRHDALRMRFTLDGGTVRQAPAPPAVPELTVYDRPVPLDAFVRPFRVGETPLLRAMLVRTGARRHELYLDLHHVVFDGVSLRILVDELFDAYLGAQLPPPEVGYLACAQWSHGQLAARGPEYAAAERYWLRQLADPPVLALPTDRPRGNRGASRGAVLRRVLAADWSARIRTAARAHRTTPFVILLAGYFAMLARLSGQRDLVVGTPVSGRTHPAADAVIGMFVNTVCLRAQLTEASTMEDLVAQLDRRSREALTHQAYPFQRLVARLDAGGDPGRNPLFDTLFAVQDIEFYEFHKGELDISVELVNPGTTRFDLNLQAYLRPDRYVLDLEYATELFEQSSIDYLVDLYLKVLAQLLDDPGGPVYPVRVASGGIGSDLDFDL